MGFLKNHGVVKILDSDFKRAKNNYQMIEDQTQNMIENNYFIAENFSWKRHKCANLQAKVGELIRVGLAR